MASTYTPIATTTLGSNTGTVTFNSISGSYTDLVLVANAGATAEVDFTMRLNNDSGSNYSFTNLSGNGTSASSSRRSNKTEIYVSWEAPLGTSIASTTIVQLMNYSNSNTYKTVLSRNGKASGSTYNGTDAIVGLWRSTSAITRIDLITQGSAGIFSAGSTFTLYGIKAA